MQEFILDWNNEKNEKLKQERSVSFEIIMAAIEEGGLIDIINHPNAERYEHQEILCVRWNDYIYLVPFVRKDNNTLFLKTIIPSRKATKKYS